MITGVVAQEPQILARGHLASGLVSDNDNFLGGHLSLDSDQLLVAGVVADADSFLAPESPQLLWPRDPTLTMDLVFTTRWEDRLFLPQLARDQVLAPALYVAADSLLLASVAIPGFLLPALVSDVDVILPTPLRLPPGIFLAPIFSDLDTIFATQIAGGQMLFASLLSETDVVRISTARIALGPPFFLPDDFVPNFITGASYFPALVIDPAIPVAPPTRFDGSNANATLSPDMLTVWHANSLNYAGARSTLHKNGGKYYFEIIWGDSHGLNDCSGLVLTSASFQDVAQKTNTIAVYNNFNVFGIDDNFDAGALMSDGSWWVQFGAVVAGDVLSFAFDLNNRLAWVRKNGGAWNNNQLGLDVVTGQDPAISTGGVPIPGGDYAPVLGFGGQAGSSQTGDSRDNATGNFGMKRYVYTAPAGFGDWVVGDPFGVSNQPDQFGQAAIGVPASFDAPPLNVAMTNGNLTATRNNSTVPAQAESNSQQNWGKYYFEVTILNSHGASDSVGILMIPGGGTLTTGALCATLFADGSIWSNAANTGKNLGHWVTGDVIGVAVDLTEQTTVTGGLIWFRRNGDFWNGDSTASPALGTNGFGVPLGGFQYEFSWAPAMAFGGTGSTIGDNMTGNFGQTPFMTALPAGFGIWPTARIQNVTILGPAPVASDDAFLAHTIELADKSMSAFLVSDNDVHFNSVAIGGDKLMLPALFNEADVISAPFISLTLAKFDSATTSDVTLSNANLTATHANTNNNSGARSSSLKNTGKFYFEVTMTQISGAADCVGILAQAGSYTNLVTNGTNCTVVYKTGTIFSNGANSAKTLGAMVSGDVIGIAVDFTGRKAWLRKNGGLWNGDNTHNPVTGAGGVTVATTVAFAPAVGFGGSGTAAGDNQTANFGGTAYGSVAPSGFLNWSSKSDVALAFTPALLTDADTIPAAKIGRLPTATFDGTATNVTLSNGNLTATHNTATADSGARSTLGKTTGKFYFEIVVGQTTGASDAAGITYGTYANMDTATPINCLVARLANGNIYGGNINSGKTLGAVVAGDVLGVAVDIGVGRGWICKNGGNWNGDGTANPVTNTGGAVFTTSQTYVPAVVFGGTGTAINDAITARFGPTGYTNANAQPTGFGDWS